MVFENLGPPFSNFMEIIYIPCIVQEIQTYEIEYIFLNHAVYYTLGNLGIDWRAELRIVSGKCGV